MKTFNKIAKKKVKARKQYNCFNCECVIEKGEEYLLCTVYPKNEFFSNKIPAMARFHTKCM